MKLAETTCACGCGERFVPKRRNQKYRSLQCRDAAKNRKGQVVRVPVGLVPATKALLSRRKAGLHRLSKPKHPVLPKIRLAALWLKNRLEEQNKNQGQQRTFSRPKIEAPQPHVRQGVESALYTEPSRVVFGGAI